MAVSKTHDSKSPSQRPEDFYKSVQQGGPQGSPQKIPQELSSGPMRETVMGRKTLHKQGNK